MSNKKNGFTTEHTPPGGSVEPPRPLMREIPPADPFPIDALGTVLGNAARAINDRVRSPLALCGQSVLAAATLAVQGHADVILPIGQTRPVSEYFLLISETGERKTATDHEAQIEVQRRERFLLEQYDINKLSYDNNQAAWEAARAAAIKKAAGDKFKAKAALETLGPAPEEPLTPILTCDEPTFEGLCKHLIRGNPSTGIFSDEAGLFIGGHAMAEEKKLMTAAGLSKAWDGAPLRRVRADGSVILPGRRISLHLMAQSDVAAILLTDQLLLNQGLLTRVLMTAPDSTCGERLQRAEQPTTKQHLHTYNEQMAKILATAPRLAKGKMNQLDPRGLELSPAAKSLWEKYADYVEKLLKGELAPIRGLGNKLAEHAIRLASSLVLFRDLWIAALSKNDLEAGITLADHYAAEALRMYEACRVNAKLLRVQRLLAWLLGTWDEPCISLPDIYQRGPNSIRDRETAKGLVTILEEHGWLVPLQGGTTVSGQFRREAWKIVKTATGVQANGQPIADPKPAEPLYTKFATIPREVTPAQVAHPAEPDFSGFSNFSGGDGRNPKSEKRDGTPAKVDQVAKVDGEGDQTLAGLATLAGVPSQNSNCDVPARPRRGSMKDLLDDGDPAHGAATGNGSAVTCSGVSARDTQDESSERHWAPVGPRRGPVEDPPAVPPALESLETAAAVAIARRRFDNIAARFDALPRPVAPESRIETATRVLAAARAEGFVIKLVGDRLRWGVSPELSHHVRELERELIEILKEENAQAPQGAGGSAA